MLLLLLTLPAAGLVLGTGVGYVVRKQITSRSVRKTEEKSKDLILSAKNEALKIKEEATKEEEKKRTYLESVEKTLREKETSIDRRLESLDNERVKIQKVQSEIEKIKTEIIALNREKVTELAKIAKLDRESAKQLLFKEIEQDYREDIVAKIKAEKEKAQEEAENYTRKVVATVLQRVAIEQTSETTTSSVVLPSEEMKGRIIGREGRNIQSFEKITGVDVIIDDTPDTVVISSFDPIRRQVAKNALERLIVDGRIHPARIEEMVEKAKEEIGKEIKEAGEAAAYEVGVGGLNPDLLKILGRLRFRTSFGQNVLRHSVETALIGGMLATEIGADVSLVKKAALLHDIGKAIDHEVPGSHHHISGDIARKYGLSEDIVHAIMAHHDDIDPKTVEAIIVRVSDAISGSRPGARRESIESYIKRLSDLENIANSFAGVEKSYAIQAGREVRILVKPEEIDDLSALKLAKDIAQKVEKDLQYPGTIKVNVIRETRATEIAK